MRQNDLTDNTERRSLARKVKATSDYKGEQLIR